MAVPGVKNICANFHEFHNIHTLTFWASRINHFREHGMENVFGMHISI